MRIERITAKIGILNQHYFTRGNILEISTLSAPDLFDSLYFLTHFIVRVTNSSDPSIGPSINSSISYMYLPTLHIQSALSIYLHSFQRYTVLTLRLKMPMTCLFSYLKSFSRLLPIKKRFIDFQTFLPFAHLIVRCSSVLHYSSSAPSLCFTASIAHSISLRHCIAAVLKWQVYRWQSICHVQNDHALEKNTVLPPLQKNSNEDVGAADIHARYEEETSDEDSMPLEASRRSVRVAPRRFIKIY